MPLPYHNIPIRPSYIFDPHLERDVPLRYRSTMAREDNRYPVTEDRYIYAQCRLYQWVCSLDYERGVALRDLADYLGITMHVMGKIINQSLTYDPRRMKGITLDNPKSIWLLDVNYREELQYGMEWQICSWLDVVAATEEDDLAKDLDELARSDEKDLKSLFLDPAKTLRKLGDLTEPSWPDVMFYVQPFEEQRIKNAEAHCKKQMLTVKPKTYQFR